MAGAEALGIKTETLAEAALGLCGGVGFQGKTCGAITGAAMVVSLAVAAKEKDYKKRKLQTGTAVGRLSQAFEKEVGSADCRKITGLDLTKGPGGAHQGREMRPLRQARRAAAGRRVAKPLRRLFSASRPLSA
jgi:C_GCAxxG_C_C family probable redox protein